ncbi:MAG TPA: DUF305 domain-containing protein [Pseudonocardiaceae bacterium]
MPGPGRNEHNQADIDFVDGMNPHHGQAVEMARLALGQAQSPQVRELAARIEAAQGPELATMQSWEPRCGAARPPHPRHATGRDPADARPLEPALRAGRNQYGVPADRARAAGTP